MGPQESTPTDISYPSTAPLGELDVQRSEEEQKAIDYLNKENDFFKQRADSLRTELQDNIHLDPSYFALLQLIAAQQENFNSGYSSSQAKDLISKLNTKSNELIYQSKETVIKELAKSADFQDRETILKKKQKILEKQEYVKKLKDEIEKLKQELESLQNKCFE